MLSEAMQILFPKNYAILSAQGIFHRLTSHGPGNNRNMKNSLVVFLAALTVTSTVTRAQEVPQKNLQRTTLSAGIHQIDAQLAITPAEHAIGLMYRKEMEQHEGMLFVFPTPALQCFWMKNTLIPLTVAFLADDGMILNMDDMKPQTEESHCSIKSVRYVLEMNRGWFAKKGIKVGMKLTGQPFTNPK